MVKTSELTGDLPETLDDMANYYREIEKTKKQMISAITYPAVVLVFAISVLVYIMVSVIPQFVSIYSDLSTGLPKITVIIIGISNFLKTKWMYLLLAVLGVILTFVIVFKTVKVFRTVIQSLLMNTPIIGKIIIYNEVTMFTKTFASLLNHNVYITDAMEVLSKITNNEVYKMLIFDTITNLAKGEVISNSFKDHWAFPNIAYEMILTGEKTGQLGNMMDKVANYYQEQHKNAVNQIKAFIEPVMIVILAAIVGVVLLSVVLPMFDIYQNLS
jgi:type IV pilus assembly protein PilC